MSMISIDGTPLPNPKTYKVKRQDLDSDSTTRTETGKLKRDRIRAGIYTIDISWELLSWEQIQLITGKVAPESFSVTFVDGTTGNPAQTAVMYSGDREAPLAVLLDVAHPEKSSWGLSFTLIEF